MPLSAATTALCSVVFSFILWKSFLILVTCRFLRLFRFTIPRPPLYLGSVNLSITDFGWSILLFDMRTLICLSRSSSSVSFHHTISKECVSICTTYVFIASVIFSPFKLVFRYLFDRTQEIFSQFSLHLTVLCFFRLLGAKVSVRSIYLHFFNHSFVLRLDGGCVLLQVELFVSNVRHLYNPNFIWISSQNVCTNASNCCIFARDGAYSLMSSIHRYSKWVTICSTFFPTSYTKPYPGFVHF